MVWYNRKRFTISQFQSANEKQQMIDKNVIDPDVI
jgi:hypothetical protein